MVLSARRVDLVVRWHRKADRGVTRSAGHLVSTAKLHSLEWFTWFLLNMSSWALTWVRTGCSITLDQWILLLWYSWIVLSRLYSVRRVCCTAGITPCLSVMSTTWLRCCLCTPRRMYKVPLGSIDTSTMTNTHICNTSRPGRNTRSVIIPEVEGI